MSNTPTPAPLAQFETWQIRNLSPQQRSDFAAHLIESGFSSEQVEKSIGRRDPTLTPTKNEKARADQAAILRKNWTGDRATLEAALKKSAFSTT